MNISYLWRRLTKRVDKCLSGEESGLNAEAVCNRKRENPFVYKLPNGEVMVDFRLEERFSVEEWVKLVRNVNDRLFDLLMERQRKGRANG
jgi:hypothetical protein